MVTFAHPVVLALILPALLVFWWIARHSNAPLARDQVAQSLTLRALAVILIAAAIAEPTLRRAEHNKSVMFLIDVSRSISPAQRAAEYSLLDSAISSRTRGDSVGVISFAASPSVDQLPTTEPTLPTDQVSINDDSTDIGAAIRTAAADLPALSPRQIVLITDGNQTTGDAQQQAAGSGIPVSIVEPASFLGTSTPEVSVQRADLPPAVHENEPTTLRAVISSLTAQTAKITVRSSGVLLKIENANLAIGKNLVAIPIKLAGAGLRQVEIDVDAPQDTLLENNRNFAVTQVIGKPRILYLTDQPDKVRQTIGRVMNAQSIDLAITTPTNAPSDIAGFSGYDAVVLSDLPASELTTDQQNALQSSVRDFGMGLGMVGGTNSYISGGWAGTSVEEALPVLMKPRSGVKMPAADVVIVLDASSSMGMEENGVEKVQLAARAAVSLLGAMQPGDRVAVIATTTVSTLVTPFTSPRQALAAKKDIEGVEADGGGIYCLTGLQSAYNLMDSSKASIKHVIICADTDDSEEQEHCVDLARTMRLTEHVTTSVCGIGSWHDHDVSFQKALAAAGGGQLFIVTQAGDLPQFFQRDLSHFEAPPYLEGRYIPRITSGDKVLAGLNTATEPPLLGYNTVTPKPDAHVAMRAPATPDPILAYETYGLGHTFAFTSDETDHWAKPWLGWSGYQQFWGQLLRWSLRSNKSASFQSFAEMGSSGNAHIVVDAFAPNGSYLNGATFAATIATPRSTTSSVPLAQTAPGRYEATFPASELGAYLITVSKHGSDEQATLGVANAYPAEYAATGPNMPLLQQIADISGGQILPDAAGIWKIKAGEAKDDLRFAPACLLIGMLLFILDIAWRRLGWRIRSQRMLAPAVTAAATASRFGTNGIQAARRIATKPRQTQQRKAVTAQLDEAALLSRTIGNRVGSASEEDGYDPFPLVASIDDRRRRELAQAKRDRDNSGSN